MREPFVTVVMPVYNTELSLLKNAIRSVLSQTYSNFELLIIDNASESDIHSVVISFNDHRIKYLRLDVNIGVSGARNFAINNSKSDYIAFIDSDDLWLSEKLYSQVCFLEHNSNVGCLATMFDVIGDDAKNFSIGTINNNTPIEFFLLLLGNCLITSSIIVSRKIVEKYSISFDSMYELAEDYKFWLDFIGKANIAILDKKLTVYRYSHQNLSHTLFEKQKSHSMLVRTEMQKKLLGVTLSEICTNKFILNPNELSFNELQNVLYFICKSSVAFLKYGFSKEQVYSLLYPKYRSLFLHCHGFKSQLLLFKFEVPHFLSVPYFFKLFFLFSRFV